MINCIFVEMYNSTIISKEKECRICHKMSRIFSRGRCEYCAKMEDQKPIKRVSDKRYQKEFVTESWTSLRDDLDALVSLYVRLKEADSAGMNRCYTCGKEMHYKQLQNGHCISRSEIGLRFMVENLRPQCPQCNAIHETKPEIFRSKLEQETPGILEHLDSCAREVNKLSVSALKELVIEFRAKVRLVKIKLNNSTND